MPIALANFHRSSNLLGEFAVVLHIVLAVADSLSLIFNKLLGSQVYQR